MKARVLRRLGESLAASGPTNRQHRFHDPSKESWHDLHARIVASLRPSSVHNGFQVELTCLDCGKKIVVGRGETCKGPAS